MPKIIVPIKGMHCWSCEILIEQNLSKINGVKKVVVSHKQGQAVMEYSGEKPEENVLREVVKNAGYDIGGADKLAWLSRDFNDYKNLFWGGLILLLLFFLAQKSGLLNFEFQTAEAGWWVSLLVGLVAGISTCMALVGGLVLGLSARHAKLHPEATRRQKFIPHLFFNLGRIIGFAFLGGLFGLIGSGFKMSTNLLGFLTIFVGAVMLFLGLKLIGVFPILQNKTITLPKSISIFFGATKEHKEYSHFGSFVAGILTFFLPCGFTQAMQIYAVSTGSFLQGALVMSLFALGTAPGLLGIGGLSSAFSGRKAKIFFAVAGLAVIFLGWFNLANGSRLLNFSKPVEVGGSVITNGEVQEIRMEQNSFGYQPNEFRIKKDVKMKWIINSTNPYSCASALVVPSQGISTYLQRGENVIEFTPTKKGIINFSCSMGMHRGKFIVE